MKLENAEFQIWTRTINKFEYLTTNAVWAIQQLRIPFWRCHECMKCFQSNQFQWVVARQPKPLVASWGFRSGINTSQIGLSDPWFATRRRSTSRQDHTKEKLKERTKSIRLLTFVTVSDFQYPIYVDGSKKIENAVRWEMRLRMRIAQFYTQLLRFGTVTMKRLLKPVNKANAGTCTVGKYQRNPWAIWKDWCEIFKIVQLTLNSFDR